MPPGQQPIADRLAELDWQFIRQSLCELGYVLTPSILTRDECANLIGGYSDDSAFRSHIIMARFRFGQGDYKYFNYPLPKLIQELREHSYSHLAPIANEWNCSLGVNEQFPKSHADFVALCRDKGQTRATPLLLHYQAGDYNCLHQDLYGDLVFPLQLTVLLSAPMDDFTGGEFLLVEQRPRAQSRGEVVPLRQGEAVIFAVHHRPVPGVRGFHRVTMRHGVSRLRSGSRFTLGVIFHDAA
jgi:uncharacterized protein